MTTPPTEKIIRQKIAAEIRNWATEVQTRAEDLAGVFTGTGDDHPFVLAMEFAAQIAEGKDGP